MNQVTIGIQARSTSTRFPNKVFELIGGKEMLKHVVDAANNAASYMNKTGHLNNINVSVAVLCPTNDQIKKKYESKVPIVIGDEMDVLSRYVRLYKMYSSDFVCRITGDCPLLPGFLITKVIKTAVINRYDYCSNVDEKFRSSIDGYDVEVISAAALEWADKHAKDPKDREHVTTILRTEKFREAGFTSGFVTGYLNQSHIKLSVDTPEDLERVRNEFDRITRSSENARAYFGRTNVHKV